MSVYLYTGGLEIVRKSGVGQAILHQKSALEKAEIKIDAEIGASTKIIHINTVFPDSVIAAFKARLRGVKVVYYAHSTMEDFRCSFRFSNILAPLFKKWITFCYCLGDIILTPTKYSKAILESYGINKNIYNISNGIDTDKFCPCRESRIAFRKRYNLTDDNRGVISVGHMIERKGILDYIELAKKMPDVYFFWFGYTDPFLLPESVCDAIKCAPDNLKFVGYIEQKELRNAYCGADVFAFLSHEETEGIVVLEALACGISMIVRDISVYDGWLEHGKNVYKADTVKGFEHFVRGILNKTSPDLSPAEIDTAKEHDFKFIGKRLKEIYRT